MPLYEYECRQCGRRFEKIEKFSDEPQSICEECGGKVERLLSAPAFQFKGTGWYITDYARKSTSHADHPSGNGAKKSASEHAPASSSESKPSKSPSEKS